MNLSDIKVGEELMADIYGKVRSVGKDAWGKEYVELEVYKDKKYWGVVQVAPEWCWRLESKEKVSPNLHG